MLQDWTIQARTDRCDVTKEPFVDGQQFFTLLYRDRHGGLARRDVSEKGWSKLQADPASKAPFSFWRSKFTLPPPPVPEAFPRTDAEALLRRFLTAGLPEERRAAYILALMLERKRVLRPTGTAEEDGRRLLLYEHAKTGETFVVFDPMLRLDQVEEVQHEVAGFMAMGTVALSVPSSPASDDSVPVSKEVGIASQDAASPVA